MDLGAAHLPYTTLHAQNPNTPNTTPHRHWQQIADWLSRLRMPMICVGPRILDTASKRASSLPPPSSRFVRASKRIGPCRVSSNHRVDGMTTWATDGSFNPCHFIRNIRRLWSQVYTQSGRLRPLQNDRVDCFLVVTSFPIYSSSSSLLYSLPYSPSLPHNNHHS